MHTLISYALSFVGTPYIWGGASPDQGFDCSGLVQEILRAAGEDHKGDQTAQALYNHFDKNGDYGKLMAGSLVFFGKDTKHISHVGFMIDEYRMIEAGSAVLLVSEELEELLALSDRIYVIYEGEIMGEVLHDDVDKIGQMMTGTPLEKIHNPGADEYV